MKAYRRVIVPNKLAKIRIAMGFTQTQFAARFGLRGANVSSIENGRLPRPDKIVAAAKAYAMEPGELMDAIIAINEFRSHSEAK